MLKAMLQAVVLSDGNLETLCGDVDEQSEQSVGFDGSGDGGDESSGSMRAEKSVSKSGPETGVVCISFNVSNCPLGMEKSKVTSWEDSWCC